MVTGVKRRRNGGAARPNITGHGNAMQEILRHLGPRNRAAFRASGRAFRDVAPLTFPRPEVLHELDRLARVVVRALDATQNSARALRLSALNAENYGFYGGRLRRSPRVDEARVLGPLRARLQALAGPRFDVTVTRDRRGRTGIEGRCVKVRIAGEHLEARMEPCYRDDTGGPHGKATIWVRHGNGMKKLVTWDHGGRSLGVHGAEAVFGAGDLLGDALMAIQSGFLHAMKSARGPAYEGWRNGPHVRDLFDLAGRRQQLGDALGAARFARYSARLA